MEAGRGLQGRRHETVTILKWSGHWRRVPFESQRFSLPFLEPPFPFPLEPRAGIQMNKTLIAAAVAVGSAALSG